MKKEFLDKLILIMNKMHQKKDHTDKYMYL